MDKLRIFIYSFLLLFAGILAFTLTKSWLVYDRGIEVIPAKPETKEVEESKKEPNTYEWEESARIYWNQALVYPIGLSTESGGMGPENVMRHARNLIVVHLKTGKKRKLFAKDVYIWDYFSSDFSRKSGFSSGEEPKVESIQIPAGILIFAATVDTNQDGFLNHKDRKKVFLYDTTRDRLLEILPEDSFFEKILWNAGKDRLALVIRKASIQEKKFQFSIPYFFVYDLVNNKKSTFAMTE